MTRVALIFGGRSPEHEVSIVSARHVRKGLLAAGFEVELVGVDRHGGWRMGDDAFEALCESAAAQNGPAAAAQLAGLVERGVDVVFPIIHGVSGEDGAIQGLCEFLGLAYVGGDPLNQSLAWDKIATRTILAANGLPQPAFLAFFRDAFHLDDAVARVESVLSYPVFVKPSRTGSSIGVARVKDRRGLEAAFDDAFAYDSRVIVEQGLDARELEMAGLGAAEPLFSMPAEIIPEGEFYDFEEKYLKDAAQFEIPAQLPAARVAEMKALAGRAWSLLNCYGMARVDFLATPDALYLNEINTLPGFTPISMYPLLLDREGVPLAELTRRLVDLALKRRENVPRKVQFWSQQDWWRHNPDA